jgi:GH24 family phage-related lysozyme (muramidase)
VGTDKADDKLVNTHLLETGTAVVKLAIQVGLTQVQQVAIVSFANHLGLTQVQKMTIS